MFRLSTPRRRGGLALLGLLLACGPSAGESVKMMVLRPDATGTLDVAEVEMMELTDVVALKGRAATLLGSTKVVLDPNDPLQQANGGLVQMTDEQRYEAIVKDKGGDVRAHYVVREGVLWPEDFHTWNMVSLYYNFDRAYEYFRGLDPTREHPEIQKIPVQYWVDFKVNGTTVKDNMLYVSLIKSFVVTPFETNKQLPLAMNIGVVGHEMAHRVFNVKVLGGQGLHPAIVEWALEPFNLLKSLDEGLADFHGYSATCAEPANCNPKFLDSSFSAPDLRKLRDVSRTDACLDPLTEQSLESFDQSRWVSSSNMYKVGNVIAVALYQAGNRTGRIKALQQGLVSAYDDDSIANPGLRQLIATDRPASFTRENVVDIIAGHMPDLELQRMVCEEFSARLALKCGAWPCRVDGQDLMPHCPSTARPDLTVCDQP